MNFPASILVLIMFNEVMFVSIARRLLIQLISVGIDSAAGGDVFTDYGHDGLFANIRQKPC